MSSHISFKPDPVPTGSYVYEEGKLSKAYRNASFPMFSLKYSYSIEVEFDFNCVMSTDTVVLHSNLTAFGDKKVTVVRSIGAVE